jgi:hypothetical protein
MAGKKKTTRDKKKNPGLNKHLFSRVKQEYHDYDYIDKLSEKEKQWLSTFTEEYLGARLNHKNKKLHRTKKLKRDCFNRNNARQRDTYAIARATNALIYAEGPVEPSDLYMSEDDIIELLDTERERELQYAELVEDKKNGSGSSK